MNNQISIVVTRNLSVPPERLWSLITDNTKFSVYFPFIKSSFSETLKLDTVRVSVAFWDGLFGTLRERCIVFDHNKQIKWRVEDDSRRVFHADFIWGFQIESTDEGQCLVHLTASFQSTNWIKTVIETLRLKFMFKKSLLSLQSVL
jgi:uncharacterized protein YndB with AHSA1/START domain